MITIHSKHQAVFPIYFIYFELRCVSKRFWAGRVALAAAIQQVIRSSQTSTESVWLSIHQMGASCLPLTQTCASSSPKAAVVYALTLNIYRKRCRKTCGCSNTGKRLIVDSLAVFFHLP